MSLFNYLPVRNLIERAWDVQTPSATRQVTENHGLRGGRLEVDVAKHVALLFVPPEWEDEAA